MVCSSSSLFQRCRTIGKGDNVKGMAEKRTRKKTPTHTNHSDEDRRKERGGIVLRL